MTIQTISDPLDRLSLAEYRAAICAECGVTYANMSTAHQTKMDQIVAEAADYVSQRAAHQPWGRSETTASIGSGTDTTYSMNAQVRHILSIVEEETDGTKHPAVYTTRENYDAAINSTDTHPWTTRTTAAWFFEAMNTGTPAVQQWRRIGVDRSGATVRIYHVPFVSLSDPQSLLPGPERRAILHDAANEWFLFVRDYEASDRHRVAREDAIRALETGDRITVEVPGRLNTDSAFRRLLG